MNVFHGVMKFADTSIADISLDVINVYYIYYFISSYQEEQYLETHPKHMQLLYIQEKILNYQEIKKNQNLNFQELKD